MTLCDCSWLGSCTSTFYSLLEPAGAAPVSWVQGWWGSARLRRILSKSWVVPVCCKSHLCPKARPGVLGTALWEGCINKQVQEAPSGSAGETRGFVMVVCTAAQHLLKLLLCSPDEWEQEMCWFVLPGQWDCVSPKPAEWPPYLVFLSACLLLFSKGNFFKDPPFPLTDYQYILGIRIFQLPVVSPSLRLNGKRSRCAAKEVSAFYNL